MTAGIEHGLRRLVPVLLAVAWLAGTGEAAAADRSLLVQGGWLTGGDWKEALDPTRGQTRDSYFVGLVGAHTWSRAWNARLSFEVEGAVIKHFGRQDHVELTALPLAVRWHAFPWSRRVATSVGLGGGFSYATDEPDGERLVRDLDDDEDPEKLLFTWYAEVTAGPPAADWEGVFRLHHRSGGFGLLGEQGKTGSDFLTAGIRWRF